MGRTLDHNWDGDDVGNNNIDGNEDDDDDDNYGMDFCRGMSMTMYMKGFQFTSFPNKNNDKKADCLTFLFKNWKLDSPGKFSSAMVSTFLLAVLSEIITIHGQTRIREFLLSRKKNHIYIRKFVMTLLYGIEQCLGWALMLVSMTFSIELFVSVIFGIFVGKLLFPPSTTRTPTATTTINSSSRTTIDTTTSNNHICCPTSNRRTWGIGQHGSDIIEPLLSQSEHEIRNTNNDRNNTLLGGEEEARTSPSVNGSSTSTTAVCRRRR